MDEFHGTRKKQSYFEGWYLKQQNAKETVALIPSYHVDEKGKRYASLQVITDEEVIGTIFPAAAFSARKERFGVQIGNSLFTERGCRLQIEQDGMQIHGILRYGAFTPPIYDIMGPFCLLPQMECRHRVLSLSHRVDGWITVNGRRIAFRNGKGYLEGDRGRSFPQGYLWTQCSWKRGCIMLSAAQIPLYGRSFLGCIASVLIDGKEFRLATYCGGKMVKLSETEAVLQQGEYILSIRPLSSNARPLMAPLAGDMKRTIHESPSCRVHYRFWKGKYLLLDLISSRASFEWDWDTGGS